MTARFSWNQGNTRGHRPRLQQNSVFLNVSARDLVCPCEMFGIDQHPKKTEQEGKYRDEISKPTQARASGIERGAFHSDDSQPAILHSRRLARAQHEQKQINTD